MALRSLFTGLNRHRTSSTDGRRPTFAAIVFHADQPAMLRLCVEHHLAIGVDHFFISLNLEDDESAAVAATLASPAVSIWRVNDYSPDPLDYFDAALRAFKECAEADWVMFVDSDEFWVPAGGTLRATRGLDNTDALSVRRFNAPPIRDMAGAIQSPGLSDPAKAVLVAARQTMNLDYITGGSAKPWITARIGPKVMVRPQCVSRMGYGAHEFAPARAKVRITVPDDLLIVHFPFTDEARFRRKVNLTRRILAEHHHRLAGDQAWHWKYWAKVAEAGALSAEFAAQVVDARDLDDYIARGILTTPSRLFDSGRLIDA